MSLESRLKEKHGEELGTVDDIEELQLDGIIAISKISESDKKYLEQFSGLVVLSMSGLQLSSLENLPNLPALKIV